MVESAPGDSTPFPDDLFNLDDYDELYYDGMYDNYDYNYSLDDGDNEEAYQVMIWCYLMNLFL